MKVSYDQIHRQKEFVKKIAEPIVSDILAKYGLTIDFDSEFENYVDLPIETRMFVSNMCYKELVTPMVRRELIRGRSLRSICTKYDISFQEIRTVAKYLFG